MNSSTRMAIVLLLSVLAYSQNKERPTSAWSYPNDSSAICAQSKEMPYSASGLPVGAVAIDTSYCKPGFVVHRPRAEGLWRITNVKKLSYKGNLFAIVGNDTCYSEDGNELGYVQSFVVYDADGKGRLTDVQDPNDANGTFAFHVPNWVTR